MKATGILFTAIAKILHKYLRKNTHPQMAFHVNSLAINTVNSVNYLGNIPVAVYGWR
ncbi:hypothetical protein SNE25_26725 [Mucilaginibacter sabulilitoris]|uniref:Uncharacterized protein n=1 Tax=Mucilaginibacter sabulilitoris TaxID=1173583 RepID=A0ABZ0TJ00_9SPHI|nr:hypothetical protein [Mucilaginibacter sabulilitoris]WPU92922.1 hypothetical protein SNE25_26725 [Mucilaginibacter sabulilitoris]